jgi:peptidyl-prolyl cis-trans isomerase SurA
VSHILFPLYPPTVSKDTVAVYARAKAVYDRLQGGADFDEVAKELTSADSSDVRYETIEYFYPLQSLKAFEDAVYALPVGVISAPVRTARGFHLIRVNKKFPNPGKIQVAHILIARPADAPALMEGEEDPALLERAREVYEKATSGEDFEELAKSYSADERTSYLGGVLPYFGLGEMVRPFQTASFALENIGDISEPVRTRFGYHIIKLLGKKELAPYEELERNMYLTMKSNERNFDLYRGFDEREKRRYGYIFYQESYDELQRLCDDYFPTDTAFYNRASQLQKPLMHLNGIDFPQSEFAEYLRQYPFSTKTYSGDFLREVYGLFIRDIVTELGRRGLEVEHPEFQQLVKEYHDGILLFEVSNRRVWEQPLEDQARLESEWIAELTAKYPVEINWKLLKKLKKYIPVSPAK